MAAPHSQDVGTIRPLQAADAPCATRLHIAGQPGTFLTQLGPDILEIVYSVLPQVGFGFVVEGETQAAGVNKRDICGFISGAPGIGGVLRQVLIGDRGRRGLRLARLLAGRIMRRPVLLRHSFETLLYPLQMQAKNEHQPRTGTTIELLSIMVEPERRSRGIGSQLMAAFIAECRARAATAIEVTVDANNTGACRFYAHHEFIHVRDFRFYGRAMCIFRKEIIHNRHLAK